MSPRRFICFLLAANLLRTTDARRAKKREQSNCALPGGCTSNDTADQVTKVPSDRDFSCPPCHKIRCLRKNPKRLNCKGGITTDVCNCCHVCAKVEGELCGGRSNYLGKCDSQLQCELEPPSPFHLMRTASPTTEITTSLIPAKENWRGICRQALLRDGPDRCEEECTPEYCLANPKAICSARNTVIQAQDCQGKCQHTACSACFFQEEPPCARCSSNDFDCMRKFAKCTRKKSTCTRSKYPCKKTKKPQSGKFLCWVPYCL